MPGRQLSQLYGKRQNAQGAPHVGDVLRDVSTSIVAQTVTPGRCFLSMRTSSW